MTAHGRIEAAAPAEATLHFLRPMEGRPVAYQYDPPPGIPVRTGDYDPHRVTIRDARPLADRLSLDVEGFALLTGGNIFADHGDDESIRRAYYPEVNKLIAAATGARLVITFDHNVRDAALAATGRAGIRPPVERTHNDFTARSGRDRAERELQARGRDPEPLLRTRFAIINLWRPIGRTVEKSPLALCDARSIAPADLVVSDLVYRDRVGETYSLSFNPAQRWFYFPRLTPDEAILIKGYDSRESGVARFTAHTAFNDPTSPPSAPERASIEARALVFYPDGDA